MSMNMLQKGVNVFNSISNTQYYQIQNVCQECPRPRSYMLWIIYFGFVFKFSTWNLTYLFKFSEVLSEVHFSFFKGKIFAYIYKNLAEHLCRNAFVFKLWSQNNFQKQTKKWIITCIHSFLTILYFTPESIFYCKAVPKKFPLIFILKNILNRILEFQSQRKT